MSARCPVKNPLTRTRALIAFEALRLALVLAIIAWWGWLLLDKTYYILALEGELTMRDSGYIPLSDGHHTLRMITTEAAALILLVLVSSGISFWLAVRDIRRTKALQGFFAAMAHELRTPLASIRLQLEGLTAKNADSPYLTRLNSDTTRLEAQLERGLALARSESGKHLDCVPVELSEIWQRTQACPILPVGGIPQGRVLADSHAVELIFRNIVENAVVHGGATKLEIRMQNAGCGVQAVFHDDGKGCADAKKLGRLFAKGDASKGSGVGLYLIKALMKQMGGRAEFASRGGFAVTLIFRGAS